MHQLVEYILGIALIAGGAQSTTPLVPCVLGALVLLIAASTKSSVAAFRVLPRAMHRVVDPLLCAALVIGALQPWREVDVASQVALIGVAVVYTVVWLQSDYSERPARRRDPQAAGDRSTQVGAAMGRMTGQAIAAARRSRQRR